MNWYDSFQKWFRTKKIVHEHQWDKWIQYTNGYDKFNSYRRCLTCDVSEQKDGGWTPEEIEKYKKEKEEREKQHFEELKKRIKSLDEKEILDRRGERIRSDSRVWYDGKEMHVTDFHYRGQFVGDVFLVPVGTSTCNVGWGYTTSTNNVVVLPSKEKNEIQRKIRRNKSKTRSSKTRT